MIIGKTKKPNHDRSMSDKQPPNPDKDIKKSLEAEADVFGELMLFALENPDDQFVKMIVEGQDDEVEKTSSAK